MSEITTTAAPVICNALVTAGLGEWICLGAACLMTLLRLGRS